MDSLAELEEMATNAYREVDEINPADIRRWQKMFGFSYNAAKSKISDYRQDLGRKTISEDHWHSLKGTEGHDRESYQYSLFVLQGKDKRNLPSAKSYWKGKFLLKLDGPLASASDVRIYAGMIEQPKVLSDDDLGLERGIQFVVVDGYDRANIEKAMFNYTYKPTFIRISSAEKDLSYVSVAPKLGIDTTLPQFRPNSSLSNSSNPPIPAQDEYPVWYFF